MIEMIELYRDTRDSVGVKELDAMNPLARDRALRQEMKADGNLHPALYSNEQHYEVATQILPSPPHSSPQLALQPYPSHTGHAEPQLAALRS
jgi:hypothetical protein